MGVCLAPMCSRPSDPSVVIYAPATYLFVGRYRNPSGIICVRQNLLSYTSYSGIESVNIYLKDIYSLSVKNEYYDEDSGKYILACCCPCAGCPNRVLDIRAKVKNHIDQVIDVHIGVGMHNPEEFIEKLDDEVSRHRSFATTNQLCSTAYYDEPGVRLL